MARKEKKTAGERGRERDGSTGSKVPASSVGQTEPVFQQSAARGGFGVGSLVQRAEVSAVGRGWDLGAEDDDVEMLALPFVVGGEIEERPQPAHDGVPVE